jgi:DNA-binding XRE family transcriptional regulator
MIPNELVSKIKWSRNCGQILKQYRIAAGFKQGEAAAKANLSRQAYSDIEWGRNQQTLSYVTFLRIFMALGVNEEDFFKECLKKGSEST